MRKSAAEKVGPGPQSRLANLVMDSGMVKHPQVERFPTHDHLRTAAYLILQGTENSWLFFLTFTAQIRVLGQTTTLHVWWFGVAGLGDVDRFPVGIQPLGPSLSRRFQLVYPRAGVAKCLAPVVWWLDFCRIPLSEWLDRLMCQDGDNHEEPLQSWPPGLASRLFQSADLLTGFILRLPSRCS